ncbi:ATP-binding cassette domain-containing protein [Rhodospirillaceae bacterium SYSU D60014]|uniref:ATP-binding cassette domain-containing protein n=1 Tax=Virgifigura deserti TaxID=2268457 RepID=UPI000E6642CF
MSGDTLIRFNRVTKRFGEGPPALDAISADVTAGRITGLVGPDGAGKTTFIRLVTGLMVPDEGGVSVLGHDTATDAASIFPGIGYMPQRFGLYEDLSVQENLNLYAELRGLPAGERPAVFDRLLRFTDLQRFTGRLAGRLSGGMKQKLGLACALMRTPPLLLLDEPSVGVDPISRRELWAMVKELTGGGMGVVWSTAYLDEAQRCDSVLLLNQGRLLFDGDPRSLMKRAEGRVFQVRGLDWKRRAVLARMLAQPDVIDGVIQGRHVRVVYKERVDGAENPPVLPPLPEEVGTQAHLAPVPPRFEDAFMDILGGGPGGRSALAERIAPVEQSAGGEPVIEARGLTKRFGDFTAARDITFSIPRGEIFGLLGPNGAGKSTTFKMLCGLLAPTEGAGRVAGFDLRRAAAQARQRLGYMAQKFSLYGDLSARQNLDFFSGVYGLGRRRRREQVELMIRTFDFGRLSDTAAKDLPLGFKQRLALACAIMHEPEALFLDEPTSGVDPITRREFWTHINGLVEKGVTVLVTTHFMDEAEYCDRIALIYRGRTIATGSPDELKERVQRPDLPDPTLEDAFIALVEESDLSEQEVA